MEMIDQLLGGLFGLCIGDALGVPYEFTERNTLRNNPAKDMIGYGTHFQPPGTWSDDSSLTFCLAGIYYGFKSIPSKWIDRVARKEDILNLAERFYKGLSVK